MKLKQLILIRMIQSVAIYKIVLLKNNLIIRDLKNKIIYKIYINLIKNKFRAIYCKKILKYLEFKLMQIVYIKIIVMNKNL